MRNAMLGSFVGVLAAFVVIAACGGSGEGRSDLLVVGQDLLAIAQVDGHVTSPVVNRYVNNMGPAVTVTRESEGKYIVDFGFDLSDCLWLACAGTTQCGTRRSRLITAGCVLGNSNALWVHVYDTLQNSATDNGNFIIAVY